jgi:hypothetical protein
MPKHKLIRLNKIIQERIGSLSEEVETATNAKLNPLYIVDRKDEIKSLQWTARIISWVLDRAIDGRQQIGVSEVRSEFEEIKKFENMLHDKIQELEIELEDSNTDREKEIVENQIDTLKCVLGHLFNLKYGENARATEIVAASNNYWQTNRLIKVQDIESSAQNAKLS